MYRKIFLIGTLIIFLFLFCSSCTGHEVKTTKIDYDSIQLPFEKKENDKTTVCYSDDEKIILSLWTRNIVGDDLDKTKGIYLLNYQKGPDEYTFYNIKSKNVIYSALPYQDGILFVDYDIQNANGFEYVKWQIKFSDSERSVIIDEGICSSESRTPYLCMSNDVPVYFCETIKDGETDYTLNTISGLNKKCIESITGYEPYNMKPFSNEKEFCILLKNIFTNEIEVLVAANNGIEQFIKLEMNLDSVGITKSQIICTLSDSSDNYKIASFSLEQDENVFLEYHKPLYRIKGSDTNICVAVDGGFSPYILDISKNKIERFDLPEGYDNKGYPVAFYPAGTNGYIIDINAGNYFYMNIG